MFLGALNGAAGRWVPRRRALHNPADGEMGGGGESTPKKPLPFGSDTPFTGDEPRILIVDDENSVRRVCTFALRGLGWQPEGEGMPKKALERIAGGEHFDVVVLDFAMPEMNGLEFLRALSALPATVFRPHILMASAHADGAVAKEAMSLGVWDFLAKPLMPDDIRRRTRRLLNRSTNASNGQKVALALTHAARREWASALGALDDVAEPPAPLLRGLLQDVSGNRDAARLEFARAYWNPSWSEGDADVWSELSLRLDYGE